MAGNIKTSLFILLVFSITAVSTASLLAEESLEPDGEEQMTLRAWGVPNPYLYTITILTRVQQEILAAFTEKMPNVKPVSSVGLQLIGRMQGEVVPLMQIAAGIAPEVLYVNFRKTGTYIDNKFLFPLDRYVEQTATGEREPDYIVNSHLMELEDYLAALRNKPFYDSELKQRVPHQCWQVIRRRCPYEMDCPYVKKWQSEPAEKHYHVWAFPQGVIVQGLAYTKSLFTEAGLPNRAPADWDELMQWSRKLTNPPQGKYGITLRLDNLAYSTINFLYSAGGRIIEQDKAENWRCVFDSPEAVEAYYFVARLFLERFTNEHGTFRGVVHTESGRDLTNVMAVKTAMHYIGIDDTFLASQDVNLYGFGPVPKGPGGKSANIINSQMMALYAGLEDDKPLRDAAWEYIRFYGGPEARKIRAKVFVEHGYGRFLQPSLLRETGYEEYLRQAPRGWEEAYNNARSEGVPEPYGKNCQLVYNYVSKALQQIRTDRAIHEAIDAGDEAGAKARIYQILQERVTTANEKMLGVFTPGQKIKRKRVAAIVVVVILVVFSLLMRRVFRTFAEQTQSMSGQKRGLWQFFRYKWAYILLIPAVGTIALWSYYPLVAGTVMAFQNYNVRGFSQWVGLENVANVIYDREFWYSLWVTVQYALMYMIFGFVTPIVLAFLLTEVPKGKIMFRLIYYLPAVLTGVVVLFLWKGFYGEYGMINQCLNLFINLLNILPDVAIEHVHIAWLESPRFALFFCLLPTVWAGLGPGCLIYLAALKTIPEDLYEAADLDGAGTWHKAFHVAIPGIKALILINFIGSMVGMMKSGGEMMLAMTGGGPFTPYGQTEVAGLHIWMEAFGYLRFGSAVSMAWILGAMLLGFTVLQMQKLSKMEFKTVESK
jgi:multiple sugar transport system permease protein